jgi:hypothetical protein
MRCHKLRKPSVTATTSAKKPITLVTLPSEIKILIWNYCQSNHLGVYFCSRYRAHSLATQTCRLTHLPNLDGPMLHPTVFHVKRQVYREFKEIFGPKIDLTCSSVECLEKQLNMMSRRQRGFMTQVTVFESAIPGEGSYAVKECYITFKKYLHVFSSSVRNVKRPAPES